MKQLKIIEMEIKNFKGIDKLKIEPNGNSISIYGDNGLCKTTIFDSFLWILFNKDSTGKSDFQIKPVDEEENEIHNLDTSVKIKFDFDGNEIILEKVFHEVYTKKRGTLKKIFTGHTTEYFINEVPEPKKEFDKIISETVNPDLFKILSDPYEFAGLKYKWEDRRKILFEMCGIIDDNAIINLDKSKKVIAAKQLKLKKKIEEIPVKIKESKLYIKKNIVVDLKKKKELQDNLKLEQEDLRQIESSEKVSSLNVEINNIDSEMIKAENKHDEKNSSEKKKLTNSLDKEINSLSRKISQKESEIKSAEYNIKNELEAGIIKISSKFKKLTEKWNIVTKKKVEVSTECPTCKQDIPKEDILKATQNLNLEKSNTLEEIDYEGKKLSSRKKDLKREIKEWKENNKKREESVDKLTKDLELKEKEVKKIESSFKEFDKSSFEKRKKSLNDEIEILEKAPKDIEQPIKDQIKVIEDELQKISEMEAELKLSEDAVKRIKELELQEKDLSETFEGLEKEMFDVEKKIVENVDLLEDPINKKFKLAKFKLFENQINGGIKQICEVTNNGHKYNYGLNKAQQINVGLDIIESLSEFYGFRVPVFIDNAESVNKLTEINTQIITLSVSQDKELKIVYKEALS